MNWGVCVINQSKPELKQSSKTFDHPLEKYQTKICRLKSVRFNPHLIKPQKKGWFTGVRPPEKFPASQNWKTPPVHNVTNGFRFRVSRRRLPGYGGQAGVSCQMTEDRHQPQILPVLIACLSNAKHATRNAQPLFSRNHPLTGWISVPIFVPKALE